MRLFFGVLLVLFGVMILGNNVGWFDFDMGQFIHRFWPLILVIIGAEMIFSRWRHRTWQDRDWSDFVGRKFSKTMGDVHLKPATVDPVGLRVEQGLGDINLDLTGIALNSGVNNIDCSLGLGDIKIIVANNIPLSASCSAGVGSVRIFDKHADGFGPKLSHQDADYANADKKIFLTAKVGLGDVKVSHP